jgi:hypothetical protein
MDAVGLAHTLKPLARDGLVAIDVDPKDRRNRLIRLTRSGQAKLKESDALWEAAQRSFEAGFGGAESYRIHGYIATHNSFPRSAWECRPRRSASSGDRQGRARRRRRASKTAFPQRTGERVNQTDTARSQNREGDPSGARRLETNPSEPED